MSTYPAIHRDLRIDVALNGLGFLPGAQKNCVIQADGGDSFSVMNLQTGETVFTGPAQPTSGDFGRFSHADFTAITATGTYIVQAGSCRSYPFRIAADVYVDLERAIVSYFAKQRCGPSMTGYLAPCHCDDGVRLDNGQHQDVTGGWHDASDLRKWVSATLYGMVGLLQLSDNRLTEPERTLIREELQWGNRYFLNMQDEAGFVMNYVGGDILSHSDSNRWTDNRINSPGGSVISIPPAAGHSTKDVTICGSGDDRIIQTSPASVVSQYLFAFVEAKMAARTMPFDPGYANRCRDAATRCISWCRNLQGERSCGELAMATVACLELHRLTGGFELVDEAASFARQIQALQVTAEAEPVRGYFQTSIADSQPFSDSFNQWHHAMAFIELLTVVPQHQDAASWRRSLSLYLDEYLLPVARRNHFGIVPYGIFPKLPVAETREHGHLRFRYFLPVSSQWYVGINANVAGAGVALARAARVLNRPDLMAAAQRQLDWILGANPCLASTIESFGHNQPERFINHKEFWPPTPRIPGAVMNGLVGTADDQPETKPGSWQSAEYWTPMVGYTAWLVAELSNAPVPQTGTE